MTQAAAVHLYLFTLAGSLRNKAALPASLPSAEGARQHLQEHLAEHWQNLHRGQIEGSEDGLGNSSAPISNNINNATKTLSRGDGERQMYWQTYASGSVQVIIEQEAIGELIIKLMGQHVFKVAEKNWARARF